jgi:hypothetical protein
MQPSKKNAAVANKIDEIASELGLGQTRTGAIKTDTCVSCKKEALKFKDSISRREFAISGLCQECQDSIFG